MKCDVLNDVAILMIDSQVMIKWLIQNISNVNRLESKASQLNHDAIEDNSYYFIKAHKFKSTVNY